MSDSIKKIIFGSVSNYIPLKIGIHVILQYLGNNPSIDKNNKKDKLIIKQRKKKEEKIKPFTPKKYINKDKDKTSNVIKNSNSGINNKINSLNLNLLNNSLNKISKKDESFITHLKNNKMLILKQRACSTHRQKQKSPKIKSMKNTFIEKEKEKEIKTEINVDVKK